MVMVTVMKMKMLNGGDDNSGDDEYECAVCGNNGADNVDDDDADDDADGNHNGG